MAQPHLLRGLPLEETRCRGHLSLHLQAQGIQAYLNLHYRDRDTTEKPRFALGTRQRRTAVRGAGFRGSYSVRANGRILHHHQSSTWMQHGGPSPSRGQREEPTTQSPRIWGRYRATAVPHERRLDIPLGQAHSSLDRISDLVVDTQTYTGASEELSRNVTRSASLRTSTHLCPDLKITWQNFFL